MPSISDKEISHAENCWAWGPSHYLCAYTKIMELLRDRPKIPKMMIEKLSEELNMPFDDLERVIRITEILHEIPE